MNAIQNQILRIISCTYQNKDTEEVVQVITSLFECLKNENNDLISNIKDLREEVNDLISDLKDDISTIQKEVDSLKVEIDNINQYEDGNGLVISGDIIPHSTPTENCKEIVLNLFWHHLNINLGDDEISFAHRIGEKTNNAIDNRKIFIKPSRKQLSYRIFQASCDLNPPFYINYYSDHTRRKIDYIIRQLKTKFPEKIMGYHSYNNETCILFNICDYSTNLTSTFDWIETENQTMGEPKNQNMDETENRRIHVSIKTIADLERFITMYHSTPIYNKTSIHFKTYDHSTNAKNTFDDEENENTHETEHGLVYVSIKTLSDLEVFMSIYLNTTITSYI